MTTRTQLAQRLARDLSALASDAEWSLDPDGGQSEGSYTDPIDDGMRAARIATLETASPAQVEAVRLVALVACYDRLSAFYATQTDLKVGQRDEKASQTVAAIAKLRGSVAQAAAAALAGLAVVKRPPSQSVPSKAVW